jgi:carbohydrate kinase (thermoresistant glucokinase family)
VVVLVMGVAGSGKTTVGGLLASELGWPFHDGDDFHPPANVAKMARGEPLTDDDRAGWLQALSRRIHLAEVEGTGLVVACSALKRAYRDVLRGGATRTTLRFIVLHGGQALIAERLARRRGHFMPASLLESQFATLEIPTDDERAWMVNVDEAPERIVADLVARAMA